MKHLRVDSGLNVINAGKIIYTCLKTKGEFGDKFYIVLKGKVSVNVPISKQRVSESN